MCNDLPVAPTFVPVSYHATSTESLLIGNWSQPSMQSNHNESDSGQQYVESELFPQESMSQSFEGFMEDYNTHAQRILGISIQGDQGGTALPSIHSGPSIVSTPDSATFSYTQNTSAYPSPTAQWLHPYPLDHQFAPPAHTPTCAHRPSHNRANTATSIQHPPPPFPPSYARRRSLSHGDIDRLAPPPSNPTFVRLQAPRYHTPVEQRSRRCRIEDESGGNGCQNGLGYGTQRRGRPQKSHMPYALNGNMQVGGMQLTSIGTPINAHEPEQDSGYATEDLDSNGNRFDRRLPAHPGFRPPFVLQRMSRLEDIQRSNHIIQVGVMAVRKDPKIDPALFFGKSEGASSHIERAINRLDEAVDHLKRDRNDNSDALAACAALKEDLQEKFKARRSSIDDLFGYAESPKHDQNEPSQIMGDHEEDAFEKSMSGTDSESMIHEGFEGVEVDE